ncbi:MAG TPA: hypothetical protein VGD06_14915 [Acidobacteriota bacterium]
MRLPNVVEAAFREVRPRLLAGDEIDILISPEDTGRKQEAMILLLADDPRFR